jgi:DNA (cytosine-5)-methyltransferase 1
VKAATCFSGIGAPEQAMQAWDWLWHAEIEPFPAAVMAARHPGSTNLGDVLAADFLERVASEPIDVLVGGPPCQAFSVAGLRGGLADPRGNLSLRWVQIIHASRPAYAVTENVPGWLSIHNGHAFGCFLGALVGADDALFAPTGYGWPGAGMVAGPLMRAAWRVLDAKYFNLAQRRQRVFVVACPVGGGDPAEVLFERKSLRRDTPSRREARQDVAGTLTAGFGERGGKKHGFGWGQQEYETGYVVAHSLRAEGFDASEDGTGRGTPLVPIGDAVFLHANKGRPDGRKSRHTEMVTVEDIVPTLATDGHAQSAVAYGGNNTAGPIDVATAVNAHGGPHGRLDFESETFVAQAFHENQRAELTLNDTVGSLNNGGGKPGQGYPATLSATQVRRLLPAECAILQGFPPDHCAIAFRGKPASDGPMYRAYGNSMAVPCLRWILSRIEAQA